MNFTAYIVYRTQKRGEGVPKSENVEDVMYLMSQSIRQTNEREEAEEGGVGVCCGEPHLRGENAAAIMQRLLASLASIASSALGLALLSSALPAHAHGVEAHLSLGGGGGGVLGTRIASERETLEKASDT